MAAMDKTDSTMLELKADVLSSQAGSRTSEHIQKILPVLRHKAPLFYSLSKGEYLQQADFPTEVSWLLGA